MNHFAKFQLPIEFNLDLDLLEEKYFAFQNSFHPDKAGIAEIENSIAINEAYEILKNPIKRATHILQINGIDITQDGNVIKPDLATLAEVLEIQEKLPHSDHNEIANLKKYLASQIKYLLEKMAQMLDNQDFNQAAQFLIKTKYFDKILKDLKHK